MQLAHLILTRYALRSSGDLKVKLDAGWFKRRLELFKAGPLDSLCRQTCQDFTWLLFYSPEHEQAMLPVAEAIWNATINAQLYQIVDGHFENFDSEMRKAMAEHITQDTTHVLTTRIDNDDQVAEDFIELVQSHAREHAQIIGNEKVFLNFTIGRNWQDGRYIEHTHRSNMFLSVLEPADHCLGILTWAHNEVANYGRVIQMREVDRWTHVVHSDNVWPPDRYLPKDPSKRLTRY